MTLVLFFAVLGLLLYLLGDKLGGKAVEVGKLAFFAGLLAWLLSVGSRILLR